mgnify:FL=1
MSNDPQDQAEALDGDVVEPSDDFVGDAVGEGYADFPPDQLQGSDTFGTTPAEEQGGESFEARDDRYRPEAHERERVVEDAPDEMATEEIADDRPLPPAGQLVDEHPMDDDDEEQLVTEARGERMEAAEEAAVRVDPEPG